MFSEQYQAQDSGKIELNTKDELHLYKGMPLRYWVVLLRLDLYPW